MSMGTSAREGTVRSVDAAGAHRRPLVRAGRRSVGLVPAATEADALSRALAPLAVRGWSLLVDRRLPDGHALSHLLVGPVGVAVVELAPWSDPISVRGGRLLSGQCDQDRSIEDVLEDVARVRAAIEGAHPHVRVGGVLVLAGADDRDRDPADLRDVIVAGIDKLHPMLERAQERLGAAEVEELLATLEAACPATARSGRHEPSSPDPGNPTLIQAFGP